MKTKIEDAQIVIIPQVHEKRGKLAVIEKDAIPFNMKRVYYLYDIPSGTNRGGHAHLKQQSVIIAMSGSFEVILDDGKEKKTFMLNKPDSGLYIPTGIWREIKNFSSGAVCLVLASTEFDEAEYIRDYKKFKSIKGA
ncbi:sugar 3,4-ketoisomerase [Aquaticitalea lipolytica]|mgnify:FL=1|jgi:uncharacterized RmlC-like cupin family protein|uniref:sugar 3,4-ketoisomerase n=1 Tax=Aquaticitalea lipolytica TaxID=1247562 RepID=UPI0024BA3460|nr:FdtA/QdtA family cupin domain-containing protein [Aquaticitalea lipolytica]